MTGGGEDEGRGDKLLSHDEFARRLTLTLEQLGIPLPAPKQLDALSKHLKLLYIWNTRINLTGIRNIDEGIRRHACEALEGLPYLREAVGAGNGSMVDLGSGNGYPALPLLHSVPDLQGVLVESSGRKSDFLRAATRESGVGERVRVDHRRLKSANDLPEGLACVTLRAFPKPAQWIPELLERNRTQRVICWMSMNDATKLAADLRSRGFRSQIEPLRSHKTGALLIGSH